MTSPPTRRRLSSVALVVLALVLAWWLEPVTTVRQDGLRPAQTQRGRDLAERPHEPREVLPPVAEEAPLTVYVRVGDPDRWHARGSSGWEGAGPEDYWPGIDEAPWPDLPSVAALQDLAAVAAEHSTFSEASYDAGVAFLRQAREDGVLELTPDQDDPWLMLHAMQSHRISSFIDWADGLGQEEDPSSPFLPIQEDFLADAVAFAEAIVARWPEHPAADYARLQLIEAFGVEDQPRYDPQGVLDVAAELLETSDDAVLVDAATGALTWMDEDDLAMADASWLLDVLDQRGDILDAEHAEALNRFAVEQCMAAGDLEACVPWIDRYEASVLRLRGEGGDDHWLDVCAEDAELARARLVEEGLDVARTWREELSAQVWRCHRQTPVERRTRVEGTWREGWVWTRTADAQGDDALFGCLSTAGWSLRPDVERLVLDVDVENEP